MKIVRAIIVLFILCATSAESTSDWTEGFTSGPYGNSYNGETMDIGQSEFNSIFQSSANHIIRRVCSSCSADYQEVYYKRFTDPQNFDAYGYMNVWRSDNNDMDNGDFALYSTLDDALNDENRWLICNYDDLTVGAFRDCGKIELVKFQWTSRVVPNDTNNKEARFDIYTQVEWSDTLLTLGYGDNSYEGEVVDVGQTEFNQIFQSSTYYIIRRECSSCSADYQDIYYKRITDPTNFDAYGYMNSWRRDNNDMDNGDFALYSTLDDAMNGVNQWEWCNYDDLDVGAFRDCGKTASVPCQWTSSFTNSARNWANCNRPSAFTVYTAGTYSAAKVGGLNLDFMDGIIGGSISNDGTIQIGAYVFWGVIILMVVNIICFTIYCCNKCKSSNKKGYKVVKYDSEVTDV